MIIRKKSFSLMYTANGSIRTYNISRLMTFILLQRKCLRLAVKLSVVKINQGNIH